MGILAAVGEPELVPGIEHHDLFLLFLQLALLLLLARGLGALVARFGMPSVLGELTAGILLGPSILGQISPGAFAYLFPPHAEQRHLLDVIAQMGVIMLLVLTGLEINLKLIASKGSVAARISLGGLVVPFLAGFLAAQYLIPETFLTPDAPRVTFALFVGTALAISAIPVIAKVLIDLKMIKRDIGQLTLAAGMIDDAVGWILLSVVAGLATSGVVDAGAAGKSVVVVIAVLGLSLTVGRKLFGWLFRVVDNTLPGDSPKISLLFILAFGMAALTQFLEIEAVLGAFLVGIIFGTFKRFDHHLVHIVETVALGIFAPIFFARAGLVVDLAALFTPSVFGIGMLVLAVAILGKFVGAYAGAKAARLGHYEALSLGAGMNARGALEIIIATIGFNLGILGPEMYTIIVMVAIVTSLMAPPILRFTMARVQMTEEERARLAREAQRKTSFLGNVHRLLLPTRGGGNSQVAAQLVSYIVDEEEIEVTALSLNGAAEAPTPAAVGAATADGGGDLRPEAERTADERFSRIAHHLADVRGLQFRKISRPAQPTVADAIIREAANGYDLVVVGATETRTAASGDEALFSTMVDRVVQDSPCPVLVVSSRTQDDPSAPLGRLPMRTILLPTSGQEVNRDAAEVAFAIASKRDMVVEIVHFADPPEDITTEMNLEAVDEVLAIAEGVVRKEAALGHSMGVAVRTEVIRSNEPVEHGIVERARTVGADLIVLRADVRPVTERAFFGHGTDYVLRHARCPVAIISR